MAEAAKNFEIEAVQVNDETGIKYEIKDFDNVLKAAQKICDSFVPYVIQNDEQNKAAKAFRAKCNKAKDQIKDLRLSTIAEMMGKFEVQAKELEKMFDDKQKAIGAEVNAYAASKKAEKTLVSKAREYKYKVTFTNEKTLDKLIKFCEKENIELEEI